MIELSADAEASVRAGFKELCAAKGAEDLDKGAFKELVTTLFAQGVVSGAAPSAKDLDVAFVLADTDGGGSVDEEEFAVLFRLVAKGEVMGLGKRSMFGSSSKKSSFKQSFKEAKAAPPPAAGVSNDADADGGVESGVGDAVASAAQVAAAKKKAALLASPALQPDEVLSQEDIDGLRDQFFVAAEAMADAVVRLRHRSVRWHPASHARARSSLDAAGPATSARKLSTGVTFVVCVGLACCVALCVAWVSTDGPSSSRAPQWTTVSTAHGSKRWCWSASPTTARGPATGQRTRTWTRRSCWRTRTSQAWWTRSSS